MFQYSAIKLSDDFTNYVDETGNPIQKLDNLSKVNIFVGPNNSGKSRFLRKLSQIRQFQFRSDEDILIRVNNYLQEFNN